MPTLEEILNSVSGEENIEKTAGDDTDSIEKLASDLGLIKEDNMSLHQVYQDHYAPEEELLEKSAEMDKEAEVKEAMGAYAYDHYVDGVANILEKIAVGLLEAHSDGSDDAHPQRMESNEDTDEEPIDTDGDEGAEGEAAMGTHPEGAVGEFRMQAHPNGEQIKKAALQKAMILAQLED